MVTRFDRDVGRVLDLLEELNLADDTLVIFSSDNGPTFNGGSDSEFFDSNGPLRGLKGGVYEGGIRVPMIARWPGKIMADKRVTEPLHMVDWYPTLLNLAGASLSQKLPPDGRDAWPTIASGKPSPHEEILHNTTPGNGAIRVGDWKLVLNGGRNETGGEELADAGEVAGIDELGVARQRVLGAGLVHVHAPGSAKAPVGPAARSTGGI